MKTVAIIPAAGAGTRIKNASAPKQFVNVGGRELLEWTLMAVAASPSVDSLIIVAPPDQVDEVSRKYTGHHRVKSVIAGGETRNHSVYNGIQAAEADMVVIHDAARPYIQSIIIENCIKAARQYGAATAAITAVDTLKHKDGPFLGAPIDRDRVLQIQTPQVFQKELLIKAWEKAGGPGAAFTDETSMLTEMGIKVAWVEGSPSNVKVTTQDDLNAAASLLG